MLEHHDHTLSRRAKLFALHQQMMSAGRAGARIMLPRRAVLDDATAKDIQVTAIASLRAEPQGNDR
jgi:hypothetical protein